LTREDRAAAEEGETAEDMCAPAEDEGALGAHII